VVDAVAQGRFHVYTADHVSEGLELLTGTPSGMKDTPGDYAADTVLGRAQATLRAYRQACQAVDEHPPKRVARKPPR
jgi:hypothetical protein